MTKKIFKITCLVMAIVMMSFVLASCSLFQVNEERYRSETAFEVGDVSVTVGDFADFYANTMAQYLDYGYDMQTVWDSLGNQLLLNFIVLNEIKSDSSWKGVAQNPYGDVASKYENAQYLTKSSDMELLLKNVRASLYETLDGLVETELSNTYKFAQATEEEDRPLNVLEPGVDFVVGAGALAATDFKDDLETLDEYLDMFKACQLDDFNSIINTYVFDESTEGLTKAVQKLNDRIEQEEGVEEGDEGYKTISTTEYINAQKSALNSMVRVVDESYYGWTMEQFIDNQLESAILSRLAQEYAEKAYVDIEAEILTRLKSKLDELVANKQEYYALYPSAFAEDITNLSDDSFLYFVPQQHEGEYAFVKNLLVQFSEEQMAELKQYERFGKDSAQYKMARINIALQLDATDYNSEMVDGEYSKVENIFKLENGEVVLNDTVLKTALENMATPGNISQRNVDFDKLIDQYNEDPGMQGTAYDYVLRVKEPDVAEKADAWVAEFSLAGRKAIANGLGSYEIAVTDYGVHIVYFSGYVTADSFNFDDETELYTPGTATYRFFKTYYDAVKDTLYDRLFEELTEEYKETKITLNDKVMNKLLKEYGFELNWEHDESSEEEHNHDHNH